MARALAIAAVFALSWLVTSSIAAYDDILRHSSVSQYHHGAFQDVSDSVRAQVHSFLHSRAELPFQVPLEVNVILVGFNGDGGYRYSIDAEKLKDVLNATMPTHRPFCLENGRPLDIEHKIFYNVIPMGQIELISLEHALKESMAAAGNARESEFGKELPLFEIEATKVEPVFDRLYRYMFGFESEPDTSMNRAVPNAIFILNFDKVRMDPRVPLEETRDAAYTQKIEGLTLEQLKEQEGGYVYKYRYNGGASSQVWLSSGRYAVIDLSAGPCTYGKIDSPEGSVGYRSIPRLQSVHFRDRMKTRVKKSDDVFAGQLAALVASAIEHLISPDVKYETIDVSERVLVPIIVLRNHHHYSLLHSARNNTIDMQAIEKLVKKMVLPRQEVVVVGGIHNLHDHEKLAIAMRRALRSLSTHETSKDGRYRAQIKTYLDGAILRQEFKQSAEVLASALLDLADSTLTNKFFHFKDWEDEAPKHEVIKTSQSARWKYETKEAKEEKKLETRLQKSPSVLKSYGTRVVPVFVLSLAEMDEELLMEGESALWTSHDAVFVVQHESKPFPLSYVSETKRVEVNPASPQRHIVAGLAAVIGGLVSPFEKASTVHGRPLVDWLWACGHHPFGPFSSSTGISQLLVDTAMRNSIYARVDRSLQSIRSATESIEAFTSKFLRTPLGETVSVRKKKSTAEAWLEKFYVKTSNLPRPISDELIARLETELDGLEAQLVELSSLLYDHRFGDAVFNSTVLFQHSQFTQLYVRNVLDMEKDRLVCCKLEYKEPARSFSQAFAYGSILIAGLLVYCGVIFLSSTDHTHRD